MKLIDHGLCGHQVGAREGGISVARGVGFRPELEACGRIPSPVHSWRGERRGCRGGAEAADFEVRAASLGRLPAACGPKGRLGPGAYTRI